MPLHFSRDTQVYIELADTGSPGTTTVWKVPVLDGFSLAQNTNSSEITINEAGLTSRRARLLFNDSLAPVEWSFTTYMRPFLSAGSSPALGYPTQKVHAVEEVLWAMLVGASGFDGDFGWTGLVAPPITYSAATSMTVNFDASNRSFYPDDYAIYFSFSDGLAGENVYKVTSAVVNSATIDFDIDGLAQITWSGFGSLLQDRQGQVPQHPAADITEDISSTDSFIRTRLSDVTLSRTDSPAETYNIVLTGGSFTIENNLSYLTPEELGIVNQPVGNVTGPRSISGNLTCYLDTTVSPSYSAELLSDLVADNTTVRNVFALDIFIGGNGETPGVQLSLPTAHLEIPAPTIEDVLSVDIAYHGQVSSGDVGNTDEATIIYTAT